MRRHTCCVDRKRQARRRLFFFRRLLVVWLQNIKSKTFLDAMETDTHSFLVSLKLIIQYIGYHELSVNSLTTHLPKKVSY